MQTSTDSALQKIYSRNTAKNLTHFTNFPANMFLVGVRKKNISRRPRNAFSKYFESKCLYVSVYLSKNIFVSETWKVFYVMEGWIISLRRLAVWASQNILKFFILIEVFGNSTILQHFNASINSIETLKFSTQFEHQG